MEDDTKKTLESIRKHQLAQTVIQAGAVVELEAHRRQLAAQTQLMMDAREEALEAAEERESLADFLDALAEVEIAAKTQDAYKELVAILGHARQIGQAPTSAGLLERTRAKEFISRVEGLIIKVRAERPEMFESFDGWWTQNNIAARLSELEELREDLRSRVDLAGGLAQPLPMTPAAAEITKGKEIISGLKLSCQQWEKKQNELFSSVRNSLSEDKLNIVIIMRPELAGFLGNDRELRLAKESVAELERAFEAQIKKRSTNLGCFTMVVIFGLLVWYFASHDK